MRSGAPLKSSIINRRAFAFGLPLAAAGCGSYRPPVFDPIAALPTRIGAAWSYGPRFNEPFAVPPVDPNSMNPEYLRTVVAYAGQEPPGAIIVDTSQRHLFLNIGGGRAIRYGVGVGREGLDWNGRATVGRKAEWPRWIPTADMIAREPARNARWAGGMEGGLQNPLGARALYLYQGNRDTYYRIHGTNEPGSIGQSVSSGCIRMINQDVIDLHARVPVGTPVLVV
jgi:lipoprotein-anchoring transpeptidase ErfK/SrfK